MPEPTTLSGQALFAALPFLGPERPPGPPKLIVGNIRDSILAIEHEAAAEARTAVLDDLAAKVAELAVPTYSAPDPFAYDERSMDVWTDEATVEAVRAAVLAEIDAARSGERATTQEGGLPSNPYDMLTPDERKRLDENLRDIQRARRAGEDAARRTPLR